MLVKVLFGLLSCIAGALIGGPVFAMVTAQVISHTGGTHGGWTMMAGAEMAGVAGILLGAVVGIWLVFRDGGRSAGSALTWLWVGALLLMGCLGFVAFS
jgi:hypothetical protein